MLPFVPGGDLFTLIHSKNDFKKEDIKGYAYQIIKIFTFLHRNGSSVFAVVSATIRLVLRLGSATTKLVLRFVTNQKSVPLIYRDLKPENILINYNGQFGVDVSFEMLLTSQLSSIIL